LKDLICKLLRKNPDERLTDVGQLKAHPWFQGVEWNEIADKRAVSVPFIPEMNVIPCN